MGMGSLGNSLTFDDPGCNHKQQANGQAAHQYSGDAFYRAQQAPNMREEKVAVAHS
jgi:hypothetical protein